MADFYVIYYSVENSIRRLILERLAEKHGGAGGRRASRRACKTRSKRSRKRNAIIPCLIRSDDPLSYTNFGELIGIFDANWLDFSETLRSQKAMQQILSQFNKIRNVVAHSCELNDDEITRFKLLVKDWFRIQG